MSKFEVIGGRRLKGELIPQGAKNEALQVICACLLTREEVIISNIPEILDVMKLIESTSEGMGVKVDSTSEQGRVFYFGRTDDQFRLPGNRGFLQ